MSKTENFTIFDSGKAVNAGDKIKAEKSTNPHPGNGTRRKLADITNFEQKPGPSFQEKSHAVPSTTIEYIQELEKENKSLVQILAQKNKIIEQSGIELEKLRLNLLKMGEQNRQLALSNTKLHAELNSKNDRLKVLQHELGCKNALLKRRELETEEEATSIRLRADVQLKLIECAEPGESSKEGRRDEKPQNSKRRFRSRSLCSSGKYQSKDRAEDKSSSKRRQSARFKAEEINADENPLERDGTKSEVSMPPVATASENVSASVCASVKNEDKESSYAPVYEFQQHRRSSLSRPSRLAAQKIQSYKEAPINIKMRRPAQVL